MFLESKNRKTGWKVTRRDAGSSGGRLELAAFRSTRRDGPPYTRNTEFFIFPGTFPITSDRAAFASLVFPFSFRRASFRGSVVRVAK